MMKHVPIVWSFLLMNNISLYEYNYQNNCEITNRINMLNEPNVLNCKRGRNLI